MPDTRHAEHFVSFLVVTANEVSVSINFIFAQIFANDFRLDDGEETFAIFFGDKFVSVFRKTFAERKFIAFLPVVFHFSVGSVAGAGVLVQIDVVDAPIIGGKRGYHSVLLYPMFFLR